MIKEGLSAPLHAGAVKYYKERDWMKQNIQSAIQARKCVALSEYNQKSPAFSRKPIMTDHPYSASKMVASVEIGAQTAQGPAASATAAIQAAV